MFKDWLLFALCHRLFKTLLTQLTNFLEIQFYIHSDGKGAKLPVISRLDDAFPLLQSGQQLD